VWETTENLRTPPYVSILDLSYCNLVYAFINKNIKNSYEVFFFYCSESLNVVQLVEISHLLTLFVLFYFLPCHYYL